ncbi:hypothetical protein D8666_00750 [Ochrobactrum soli]|nr:hypothetical protein D8666_00750 [[Ochrobactrum] soli]
MDYALAAPKRALNFNKAIVDPPTHVNAIKTRAASQALDSLLFQVNHGGENMVGAAGFEPATP